MAMIARNFYISMTIAVIILFSGGFLFKGSEGLMWVVQILSFSVGLTLLHVLDDRDRRRKQRDS